MSFSINHDGIRQWAATYNGLPFDGVLCDPPYELGFMNRGWDKTGIAFDAEMWRLIYNLLKPGAHLLAFSSPRTYHRMAVAIEDAGFEIRDQLIWMYGCLSEDTEILTVDGWKRYHKAILTDTVVCYNIDNDNYELHKPTCKFYYDNEHTAYRIKSDTTDQIVSRNHRVIVERNRRKVFAQAETLKRQESVPILESLSALPDIIHGTEQIPSLQKQDLLSRVYEQANRYKEHGQEARKDTVSSLSENVLSNGQKQNKPKNYMLKRVQRLLKGSRVEAARTQGQSQLETRKRTSTNNQNDRRNQPKLERWFDLSEKKRQVRKSGNKICQMYSRILGYGSERRLCYGTPTASSTTDWQTTNTLRVSTPHQPRCNRQSHRELDAIQDEWGTQEIRVGSRHNTTLATVEPIEYNGKVWCVTVPTGAFIARRNGQIFITGNSGFPKSLNIGKAVDKIHGKEVTTSFKPNYKNNIFGRGLGGEVTDCTKSDNEWDGYGTALKPAHEPCVLARKPMIDPDVDLTETVRRAIIDTGLTEEIQWNNVSVTDAEKSRQLTYLSSTHLLRTAETYAKRVKNKQTTDTENDTESSYAKEQKNDTKKDQTTTNSTEKSLPSDLKTKSLTPTVTSANVVESQSEHSSRLTTSTAVADSTEKPTTAKYIQNLGDKGFLLDTELFAGTVTGLTDLATSVLIARNSDGTYTYPKELPRIIKGGSNTVANNCLKHGTGGLNIDGTLIAATSEKDLKEILSERPSKTSNANDYTFNHGGLEGMDRSDRQHITGRFPANLIHDGSDEVIAVFPQTGKSQSGGTSYNKTSMHLNGKKPHDRTGHDDNGGSASRYFYCAKSSTSERNAGLDGLDKKLFSMSGGGMSAIKNGKTEYGHSGQVGLSNISLRANHHPTVKPLSLTKYLATLIKPPSGGRLLVPFSGSGSEIIGALQAGWEHVEGVEITEEYIAIAEARIQYWLEQMRNSNKQVSLL